jgi:hypothetical protein
MINQQLLDYIKQQLQQGVSQEQIKSSLMINGWRSQDIDETLSSLVPPSQPLAPADTLSQSPSFSPQPSRGVNKILLAAVFIVGGTLIVGGGVFAYFNYFQSPEKIVQKMTAKLTEIKSLEYSGEIKAEANTEDLLGGGGNLLPPTQSTQNNKTSDFSITFTGKSDIQKIDDPKSLFSFNIKTDALEQGEFTFGLEIRTIGKVIYVKTNDVTNLEFFDLSAIKNQWIKIDIEALKEQFGLGEIEEQLKEAQNKQELSPEQIEKLKLAVQQAKIIKTTEKLPSEKIEGINTDHYKFTIDKEGIKKLFTDVSQTIQDKTPTEKELAEFDKGFEAVESLEGEIWIGKKDVLPYKISLSAVIKETDQSKTSGKGNFTLLLKNFNKPVQIDVPTQAKPLEEILGGLFGGLQGLTPNGTFSPTQSQSFNQDADIDGLPDQLETIYGTNPNIADTDGDGFKDGEEIEKGYNPNGPGRLY